MPWLGADSLPVINLFELMRQLYPLQYDPEDLQDVLWCIGVLSAKYTCDKVTPQLETWTDSIR